MLLEQDNVYFKIKYVILHKNIPEKKFVMIAVIRIGMKIKER